MAERVRVETAVVTIPNTDPVRTLSVKVAVNEKDVEKWIEDEIFTKNTNLRDEYFKEKYLSQRNYISRIRNKQFSTNRVLRLERINPIAHKNINYKSKRKDNRPEEIIPKKVYCHGWTQTALDSMDVTKLSTGQNARGRCGIAIDDSLGRYCVENDEGIVKDDSWDGCGGWDTPWHAKDSPSQLKYIENKIWEKEGRWIDDSEVLFWPKNSDKKKRPYEIILGFDTESPMHFPEEAPIMDIYSTNSKHNQGLKCPRSPSLLQLSTSESAILIRLYLRNKNKNKKVNTAEQVLPELEFCGRKNDENREERWKQRYLSKKGPKYLRFSLMPYLHFILTSPLILKTGFEMKNEKEIFEESYGIAIQSAFDLSRSSPVDCIRNVPGSCPGIEQAVRKVLQYPEFKKNRKARCSQWDADILDIQQIEYGALDAYFSLQIHMSLNGDCKKIDGNGSEVDASVSSGRRPYRRMTTAQFDESENSNYAKNNKYESTDGHRTSSSFEKVRETDLKKEKSLNKTSSVKRKRGRVIISDPSESSTTHSSISSDSLKSSLSQKNRSSSSESPLVPLPKSKSENGRSHISGAKKRFNSSDDSSSSSGSLIRLNKGRS